MRREDKSASRVRVKCRKSVSDLISSGHNAVLVLIRRRSHVTRFASET